MSVSSQETVFHHVGNGVTVTFAYNCQVPLLGDLKVYVNDVLTSSGFTAAGIGNLTGGSITFDTAPANLTTVRIERDITLERTTDYQQNGDFLARVVNPDFNRIWMALQQHLGGLNRALKVPKSETTAPPDLPSAADRANNLLSFDADGNPVVVAPAAQSATALSIELAASQGSGLLGFLYDNVYGAGTIGKWLKDLALSTGASFIGWIRNAVGAVATTIANWLQRQPPCILDFMSEAQIADAGLAVPLLDHTAAVQAAFTAAAGKKLLGAPLNFRCTSMINIACSFDGRGAKFIFVGPVINRLFNQTAEGSLTGFTLDGTDVDSCQYGLFVDTDFVQTDVCRYDLNVNNITNSDDTQSANGACFFKASSASVNLASHLDIRVNVNGVTATANGVLGDTGGSAAGILVAFNGNNTSSNIIVHDSVIRSVSSGGADPAEDSNGIHITTLDGTSATSQGQFVIRDCSIFGARKRGVKIQAQNVVVERVIVYGQTTLAGFETYAYNTTFLDCRYLAGTGAAFSSTWTKTHITRCYGESSGVIQVLNLFAGADDATVTDGEFKSTATYATFSNGIVRMTGVVGAVFDNVRVTGSTNTGSGFILTGANELRGSSVTISGVEMGCSMNASTGRVTFANRCVMNVLTAGAYRIGNGAQIFDMMDGDITASSATGLGVYLDSSAGANVAVANLNNVKIIGNGNGVLATHGSRITSCQITSVNTTGQGVACGNSYIRGNTVTKYATGYNLNFTTTAELADNVTVGTTTPVTTTGYTIFVNRNTDSR